MSDDINKEYSNNIVSKTLSQLNKNIYNSINTNNKLKSKVKNNNIIKTKINNNNNDNNSKSNLDIINCPIDNQKHNMFNINNTNEDRKNTKIYKKMLKAKANHKNTNNKKNLNINNPIEDITNKVCNQYITRRYKTSDIRNKANGEKIKNIINKVDNYLKYSEKEPKIVNMNNSKTNCESLLDNCNLQSNKTQIILKEKNKSNINNTTNRLYKHKEKDKEQIEKNKTFVNKIKERPKSSDIFKKNKAENKKNNNINIFKNLVKLPKLNTNIEERCLKSSNNRINSENDNESQEIANKKSLINNYRKKLNLEIQNNESYKKELRDLIKLYGYDYDKLKEFKKKYVNIDISDYIHKAIVNKIKESKIDNYIRKKNNCKSKNISNINTNTINIEKENKFIEESLEGNNNMVDNMLQVNNDLNLDKTNKDYTNNMYMLFKKNYLNCCLCNLASEIKTHITSTEYEYDLMNLVNSVDYFKRKGIFYLIYHKNISMIQLSIASGLIVSDQTDIFMRNVFHYICMEINSKSQLNEFSVISSLELFKFISRCVTLENKENYEELISYVSKFCNNNTNITKEDYNNNSSNSNLKHYVELLNNNVNNMLLTMNDCKNKVSFEDIDKELALRHTISYNKQLSEMINNKERIKSNITISNNFNYYKVLKLVKKSLKEMINQQDVDGRIPLHYACLNNNYDLVELLLYHNSKISVFDSTDCKSKPIDLTSNDKIKTLLLNKIKLSYNQNTTINKLNDTKSCNLFAKGLTSIIKNVIPTNDESKNNFTIKIDYIKHLTVDQIIKYSSGSDKNNYIIMSIIENDYNAFKYLLIEKSATLYYKNSSGLNALHFILKYKRWKFLQFIFNLHDENEDYNEFEESLFLETLSIKSEKLKIIPNDLYSNHLFRKFNYKAEALTLIDSPSNNNITPLYMSINLIHNDFFLFKILLMFLLKRIEIIELLISDNIYKDLCSSNNINYILNKTYDNKKEMTILSKIVDSNNEELLKYVFYSEDKNNITNDINNSILMKYNIDFYCLDKNNRNILHIASINKNKNMINNIVYYEGDNLTNKDNLNLNNYKDNKNKLPVDYYNNKSENYIFYSIWSAIKLDDSNILRDIINKNSDFYNLNSQSVRFKNTPMHIAAINKCYRSALTLFKLSEDNNIEIKLDLQNYKNKTVDDIINKYTSNKKAKKILNKIINKDIKEFNQLEESMSIYSKSKDECNNNTSLSLFNKFNKKETDELLIKLRKEFKSKNININKIFDKLDDNKNGKLEGFEFEALFTALDINLTYDEVLLVLAIADKNKDGFIDFKEFNSLLIE